MKIVVTRPVAEEALALLRPRGEIVVGPPEPPLPSPGEVAGMIGDADVLYALPASPVNADAIGAAKRLRMIATMGTGYDNIDVAAAKRRGIPVTFAPGILDEPHHGRIAVLDVASKTTVILTEALDRTCAPYPPIRDGIVHLSATQLAMLLDGLEWTRVSPKPVKQPALVG